MLDVTKSDREAIAPRFLYWTQDIDSTRLTWVFDWENAELESESAISNPALNL